MNPTPDRTLDDPQQVIADLRRQLAQSPTPNLPRRRREISSRRMEKKNVRIAATIDVLKVIKASPGR